MLEHEHLLAKWGAGITLSYDMVTNNSTTVHHSA